MAWKSPFAALKDVALPQPAAREAGQAAQDTGTGSAKNRGRVDIIRQTAHRGGKTVTVVTGFVGISQTEKEQLAKEMQKACGVERRVKEGRIEIQGDRRDDVARILTKAGSAGLCRWLNSHGGTAEE